MSAIDKAIAVAVTVVVLAGVAGAISYSHMAELARLHGETGWRAHAFPISVDGIEIVASLVLLAHRRAGTRAGWLPWAALAAGTAASVAANVAVGASDPVGRLVAGWPAVALLVSIKLLSGLLDARSPGPGPTPTLGTTPEPLEEAVPAERGVTAGKDQPQAVVVQALPPARVRPRPPRASAWTGETSTPTPARPALDCGRWWSARYRAAPVRGQVCSACAYASCAHSFARSRSRVT